MAGRILVTGVARGLGAELARRLDTDPRSAELIGIDLERPPTRWRRLRFVGADLRHPGTADLVRRLEPDVVVHLALRVESAAEGRQQAHETNAIGTMNLLAGAGSARRLVLESSTADGSGARLPSLLCEDHAGRAPVGWAGRELREAEALVNDHALANPGQVVTFLHFGSRLGPGGLGMLARHLGHPTPPVVPGFDPRLQLLAEGDAVEALRRALLASHPGVFNVAAQGVILLSQLMKLARRRPAPLLPPVGGRSVQAQVYCALTGRVAPDHLLDPIGAGQVTDTAALLNEFGWRPPASSREVAASYFAPARQLAAVS